jgi:hypothetical protein
MRGNVRISQGAKWNAGSVMWCRTKAYVYGFSNFVDNFFPHQVSFVFDPCLSLRCQISYLLERFITTSQYPTQLTSEEYIYDCVYQQGLLLVFTYAFLGQNIQLRDALLNKMSSGGSQFTIKFVNGNDLMAIGIALPIVCALIVALRYWTRYLQKVKASTDDWLIFAGLVSIIDSTLRGILPTTADTST